MRSELRTPQIKVTLRGVVLAGVLSAEIDSNNHFAADRFRVRFVASVVSLDLLHIPGGQIEIEIGLDDKWLSCVVGLIDTVNFDPLLGTVDAEGRDLSAQFIETQTDETFANRTSSEIATLFGSRHGLIVAADPTTTPIGRYYQSEHDRVTLSQFGKTMTEWDLLAFLAIREGFDLFMTGRVLRFGYPVLTTVNTVQLADCSGLHLGHAVGLARPVDVSVKSWNSKSGESVTGHALSFGIGPIWLRKITRPNLSSADAQQQAERVIADLKRHEWTAVVTMPGELGLTARSIIQLEQTKSQWDRIYSVGQISRRIDVKRGFTQTLSLQGIA